MFTEHRDFIRLLGGPAAVASALRLELRAVRSWRERNSIPGRYWPQLATIAVETGAGFTVADLLGTAPARKAHRRKAAAKSGGVQEALSARAA